MDIVDDPWLIVIACEDLKDGVGCECSAHAVARKDDPAVFGVWEFVFHELELLDNVLDEIKTMLNETSEIDLLVHVPKAFVRPQMSRLDSLKGRRCELVLARLAALLQRKVIRRHVGCQDVVGRPEAVEILHTKETHDDLTIPHRPIVCHRLNGLQRGFESAQ